MRRTFRSWRFLTLVVAGLAALTSLAFDSAPPGRILALIYVGAADCAPCRYWQQHEAGPFRQSREFSRMEFYEVKSDTLRDVLQDSNWPENVRRYRDGIGQESGVPLWLVVAGGDIIFQGSGLSEWRGRVLPLVRRLIH